MEKVIREAARVIIHAKGTIALADLFLRGGAGRVVEARVEDVVRLSSDQSEQERGPEGWRRPKSRENVSKLSFYDGLYFGLRKSLM